MTRLAAIAAAALIGLLGLVGPAAAHSNQVATDPLDGATLAVLPQAVTVSLDEKPMAVGHGLVVTGPDGTRVSADLPELVGHSLRVPIVSTGPAGVYTVGYRVVSADGHVVTGSFRFTVTSGRPAEPVPELQTAEDQNSVTAVFAVLSIAGMVAFIGVAALLLRRHSRR